MRLSGYIAFVLFILLHAVPAQADDWIIQPDGSGDAPNIQAGIDAASDGDFVLLAEGTFTGIGNRDISFKGKKITVQSQNTFQRLAIIDCQEQGRAFIFNNGEDLDSILNFVTIINGNAENGGAIYIEDCSPSINDCLIDDCTATAQPGAPGSETGGGAIYIRSTGPATAPSIVFNQITECRANFADGGGAIAVIDSDPHLQSNVIWSNIGANGGAIYVIGLEASPGLFFNTLTDNASLAAGGGVYWAMGGGQGTGNQIVGNSAGSTGGAVHFYGSSPMFNENTLAENSAATGGSGAYFENAPVEFKQNIVAFNTQAQGLTCTGVNEPAAACVIVYGNAVNDDVCGTATDIINEDPLFCEPGAEDYSVATGSPAILENNSCGLPIGAVGEGCDDVPTLQTTWGSLKNRYR